MKEVEQEHFGTNQDVNIVSNIPNNSEIILEKQQISDQCQGEAKRTNEAHLADN